MGTVPSLIGSSKRKSAHHRQRLSRITMCCIAVIQDVEVGGSSYKAAKVGVTAECSENFLVRVRKPYKKVPPIVGRQWAQTAGPSRNSTKFPPFPALGLARRAFFYRSAQPNKL